MLFKKNKFISAIFNCIFKINRVIIKKTFGKIIFLNGATSSGKTTIAKSLQAKLDEPFWHYSIDHFFDSDILPMDRFRKKDFVWASYRDSFFEGFHNSIPIFVRAGNNLIIEHIIETEKWMNLLLRLLKPFDVYFVGVHCPLAELERRELERGDRPAGGAKKDFESIHLHAKYDLELDSTHSLGKNVDLLISSWKKRA
ncbi:MAG: putative O-phosphotransferase [Chlamydiae bacterium]|nr:putative O-phosphotransferase [Chlamydiota bacterium]